MDPPNRARWSPLLGCPRRLPTAVADLNLACPNRPKRFPHPTLPPAVLRKVVARMTNDISLNEKWLALSTYLDGYFYDTGRGANSGLEERTRRETQEPCGQEGHIPCNVAVDAPYSGWSPGY